MVDKKDWKEEDINEEEANYILGLCSDVLRKPDKRYRESKYQLYSTLKEFANFVSYESDDENEAHDSLIERNKAQKIILGYLVDNSKNDASHKELVKVSQLILKELRE